MSAEPRPDIVDELRAAVPELTPSPSLLTDLRRGYARRIALRRTVYAAVPVALVVAVGVTTASIPRGSSVPEAKAPNPVVHDAAFVAAQMGKALTGADHDILLEDRTTAILASGKPLSDGQHSKVKTWVSMHTGQLRSVEYVDGQPDFESGLSAPGKFTIIDYPTHTYTITPAQPRDPGLPNGTFTPEEIHGALASGKLAITARDQQIDGQPTIELTGNLIPKDEQGNPNATPSPQRFWVNSSTYLPVRSETKDHQGNWAGAVDYTWLEPTADNQALLTVKIPPGLTER
ncbi:MAG TPA: hypothetical protein VJ914_35305 [Pseudonocardiaceae bacterium]|nr:hypothetical protein [Pseudonocardiaceae bacterium]